MCNICNSYYIVQSKNSFSSRWSAHRSSWKKYYKRFVQEGHSSKAHNDEQALFNHYVRYHREHLGDNLGKIQFSDAFSVIFVEEPPMTELDVRENFWISKLDATINISKTFLPKIK